ncbi:S-adenosyl-L-methionine-dependent methyltransferase [Xylariaceae sp. FL0662B]|nr:S-adenosyl-L-methionine-dependent methyltransferase [Xylariaceae sp. FL0662B]
MYIDGRRYHSFRSPRYPFPNDVIEQQREELMHVLVTEVMEGRLFVAPLERGPTKVLDLCTGVGLWAIEMGDQFAEAEVLGVDLSPIQPKGVPPNVTFQVDDVEDVWVHDTDYDLIHMREASSYIRTTQKVIEKAFQHLKPGGWVELQDFHYEAYSEDSTIPRNCPVNTFLDQMYVYAYSEGIDTHVVPRIDDFLRRAGFVNIQRKVYKVPFGSWPEDERARRVGMYLKIAFETTMPPCARLLALSGLTPAQIESLFAEVSLFLNRHDIHCWADYFVWSGQKPP